MSKRVVIVTGAAGSGAGGTGKATAWKFAKNGDAVVIVDINKEAGEALEKEMTEAGYKAKFIACDICDEEQIKNVVDTTVAEFGKINILVNSAFLFESNAAVTQISAEDFDKHMAVNIRGHFLMSKYAIPYLLKEEGANIVNISSIASIGGELGTTSYGIAKAGLNALTRNIATQLGRSGLRCNTILPGLLISKEMEQYLFATAPDYLKSLDKQILLNRHGNGEDVANAVFFLASDEASFITGTTLVIDGGMTCHAQTWADEMTMAGLM